MGTYLSTPVTDKNAESGESLTCPVTPVAWGVVDMQGWRKSMEDAHVAQTDVLWAAPPASPQHVVIVPADSSSSTGWNTSANMMKDDSAGGPDLPSNSSYPQKQQQQQLQPPPSLDEWKGSASTMSWSQQPPPPQQVLALQQPLDAKVFGVFDGHGGPEVARFCSLYLVSVLTQQPTWVQATKTAAQAQLGHDTMDSNNTSMVMSMSTDEAEHDGQQQQHKQQQQHDYKQTDMGRALISAFHALDRMIDDPDRRDELIRLRSVKPKAGERRDAERIPPVGYSPRRIAPPSQPPPPPQHPPPLPTLSPPAATPAPTTLTPPESPQAVSSDAAGGEDMDQTDDSMAAREESETIHANIWNAETEEFREKLRQACVMLRVEDQETADSNARVGKSGGDNGKKYPEEDDPSADDADDEDSREAVGKESAVEDQDMMMDDVADDSEEQIVLPTTTAGKVSVMFQRLLNLSAAASSGQMVLQMGTQSMATTEFSVHTPQPDAGGHTHTTAAPSTLAPPPTPTGPSASRPTLVQNGRMICNLPDHPVHAGATAIVAVLVGKTLTVANAGDSRAVLCRGTSAVPLSFDHKPLQEDELNRIQRAGGFVNNFGRVNGNLNLSRSLGDLKYKQVPGIPPQEQMITAEPDIMQMELDPSDEFILLGCDGIWDCLTNERAVEYVLARIDNLTPTQIGTEMLNEIISEDPRSTQGIGGDNMTIMIVDLKPHSRSYRQASAVASTEAMAVASPTKAGMPTDQGLTPDESPV